MGAGLEEWAERCGFVGWLPFIGGLVVGLCYIRLVVGVLSVGDARVWSCGVGGEKC